MAPQIQPGIRFCEYLAFFCQPLGDISGHADKPVIGRGVDIAVRLFLTGAGADPVGDPIGQTLVLGFQCIGDVAHHLQLVQDLQSRPAAFGLQNALEADHTAHPASGIHLVGMAAILGFPLAEGGTGCQPQEIEHHPLGIVGDLRSRDLDPYKFTQAFHNSALLSKKIR